MATGSSNLRSALSVNKGDCQIADSSQNLGSLTGAQTGAIFVKTDIPHVV